jgi:hypothetical protein
MSYLAGGPVPGSPAFRTFGGQQPPLQAGVTQVPITIQGTPTPGEKLYFTVGTDVTSVNPATVEYDVLASDTTVTMATNIATALETAIGVAGSPWSADFASSSATGSVVYTLLKGGVDATNISIAVQVSPHSQLSILPLHYPETVSTSSTEVTALKTFSYNTASGVMRFYKGQRVLVSNDVARDVILQGLAE